MYYIVIILGLIIPFITSFIINKKNNYMSISYFFYSYMIFLFSFYLVSKLVPILLDLESISSINSFESFFIFQLQGYSFFFGYIGSLIGVLLFSKLIKNRKDVIFLFLHNLLLMCGILKIGCFIEGCCNGINNIPVQLIESGICILSYIIILFIKKDIRIKTLICILIFFLERFIIYFLRMREITLYFIIVELISLFMIILMIYKLKKDNYKYL